MSWLDKLTFFFLCALIFILPVSIAGVEVFSVLAIFLFLIKRAVGRSSTVHDKDGQKTTLWYGLPWWVVLPVGLYVLFGLVSVFLSCDGGLSLKGFVGKVLKVAMVFFVMVGTLTSRERIRTFLSCFLASAFILCLDSLWQAVMGWDLLKHQALVDGRVGALMKHPNDLGAYLIVVIPLMFAMGYQSWHEQKGEKKVRQYLVSGLWLVGFLAAFTVLVMTYSRSAWVGFLFGMGLWAAIRRSWKTFALFAFLFIFVFTPVAVEKRGLSQLAPSKVSEMWTGPLKIMNGGLNSSDRLIYWRDAIRIIQDHPWTGTGLNTYSKVIMQYSNWHQNYAHNCYLQVAAELGFVGLAIFLWVLFGPLVLVLQRLKSMTDPVWRGILCAVAVGYAAILAESALDTTFYSVQLSMLIWLVMSLLVVISQFGESVEARTSSN